MSYNFFMILVACGNEVGVTVATHIRDGTQSGRGIAGTWEEAEGLSGSERAAAVAYPHMMASPGIAGNEVNLAVTIQIADREWSDARAIIMVRGRKLGHPVAIIAGVDQYANYQYHLCHNRSNRSNILRPANRS